MRAEMIGVGRNAKGMDMVQVVVQECLSHYPGESGISHSCVP